jgi:predicted metal-dependent phosphoesterase TrpH
MAYRIDFHTHTGHSSDSLLPAERLLEQAVIRGLAAVVVTDHNSLGGALQARALVARQRGRFPNLLVYVGEEIKTSEGEVTGIGLHEPIPRGLTPEATIDRIRAQGGLVVVPHPFDRLRHSRLQEPALERVAHLVDAVEVLNARTTLAEDNARARAFATGRGLAGVGGSDAHTAQEVGTAYLEIDEPPAAEPSALLAQIRRGRVGGRLSTPLVHAGSTLARWRKRLGLAPAVQL